MVATADQYDVTARFPIAKALEEQRVVTGVVLIPDTVDGHNDIISAEVIQKAAFDFLARYNVAKELGVQHKMFGMDLEMVECYIAPVDFQLGTQEIKKGSWMMSVRVLDDDVWQAVKDGDITGFSIGGTATVAKDQVEVASE